MLQTSYEAKSKDLWVFIETKDGKARNVGLELLNPGRRLAAIQGGKTVALVVGYNCDEALTRSWSSTTRCMATTAPTLTLLPSCTLLRMTAPPPS